MATEAKEIFFSTDSVKEIIPDNRCAYIVRDGAWVWTTKERILKIMEELGGNFWQVKWINDILYIRAMKDTEAYTMRYPESEIPKPQKGKRRLL